MIYSKKDVVKIYQDGLRKNKKSVAMDDFEFRLFGVSAYALDFLDYSSGLPKQKTMESFSEKGNDDALGAAMKICYEIAQKGKCDYIPELTKKMGSYQLFVLNNFLQKHTPNGCKAGLCFVAPSIFDRNEDYDALNGLWLFMEKKDGTRKTFDVFRAMNESLKKDCLFPTKPTTVLELDGNLALGCPSFHEAFTDFIMS